VYCDTIGYLLGNMLGDVVTTGGSAPFTHTIAPLNSGNAQPKSFTLTDTDPVQARAFPGMLCTDLSFTIDAGQLLTWSGSFIGFPSGTVGQPTASFSTNQAVPGFLGATTIAGTFVPTVQSATVDLKRTGTIDQTVDGNPQPYSIFVGPVDVTGKLTLIYEDESQLLNYLNGTNVSLDFNYTRGAGAALEQFKLHMTSVTYTQGAKSNNNDQMMVDITFEADAVPPTWVLPVAQPHQAESRHSTAAALPLLASGASVAKLLVLCPRLGLKVRRVNTERVSA
jgi:hypothetical protein